MLLTVNISSVASAIPDESLEPESNVLIVHNHSSSLSRERIEKNGLDAPYGKLYFEFIPGITKENIPEKHVAVEVHSGNTWVYNGSFYEGFLHRRFKDYYNTSGMLLSTYIERLSLVSAVQLRTDQTIIFDPITAKPMIVSVNDERVLKNLDYRFQPPSDLNSTKFEPHHFIYKPTITLYGGIPANKLFFPTGKSSGGSRKYSTYVRALRRFF